MLTILNGRLSLVAICFVGVSIAASLALALDSNAPALLAKRAGAELHLDRIFISGIPVPPMERAKLDQFNAAASQGYGPAHRWLYEHHQAQKMEWVAARRALGCAHGDCKQIDTLQASHVTLARQHKARLEAERLPIGPVPLAEPEHAADWEALDRIWTSTASRNRKNKGKKAKGREEESGPVESKAPLPLNHQEMIAARLKVSSTMRYRRWPPRKEVTNVAKRMERWQQGGKDTRSPHYQAMEKERQVWEKIYGHYTLEETAYRQAAAKLNSSGSARSPTPAPYAPSLSVSSASTSSSASSRSSSAGRQPVEGEWRPTEGGEGKDKIGQPAKGAIKVRNPLKQAVGKVSSGRKEMTGGPSAKIGEKRPRGDPKGVAVPGSGDSGIPTRAQVSGSGNERLPNQSSSLLHKAQVAGPEHSRADAGHGAPLASKGLQQSRPVLVDLNEPTSPHPSP